MQTVGRPQVSTVTQVECGVKSRFREEGLSGSVEMPETGGWRGTSAG